MKTKMRIPSLLLLQFFLLGDTNNKTEEYRVIGGDVVSQEVYDRKVPWIVALDVYTSLSSAPGVCAGVLINRDWILTAAHCVVPMRLSLHFRKFLGCHYVFKGKLTL
eukprot:m.150194 g.150194  ORF g.150194 m.150194 type:complete len:107 (-) comp15022_c0_seq11:1880-2200(-)